MNNYIISFIIMIAEHFDCSGNGSMIFLIWYFSTFGMYFICRNERTSKNVFLQYKTPLIPPF